MSSPLCEDVRAAFDWWREAGVDWVYDDVPTNWLAAAARPDKPEANAAPPESNRQVPSAAGAPRAAISRHSAALPEDLAGFVQWWLAAPELDGGHTTGRVAPRGERGAELMVLVPQPEREDREVLLSGPQGRLLENLLRAFGQEPNAVYFASVLPRHLPGADLQVHVGGIIGEALRHHIALVAPKRLIAFDGNILPLVGNDPPQGSAVLLEINLEGQSIPLLATRSLSALLDRPRWKGDVWKAWLSWTDAASSG
ncbi:MAG: hypothetical protein N2423_09270 [Novosphingobium sp.]|nr:hypothetical protein [Novosphingobium sp.]